MADLANIIRLKAEEYYSEIITIRRHIHQHPELSKQEKMTMEFIGGKLREYGIPFKDNVGGYGIVGIIEGREPQAVCLALRADMDALPVNETNEVDYKSANPGVMHACGHDVHMACLLGAAKILNGLKEQFRGTIKLLFQPSEETFPGGAIQMIQAGVMENPKPDFVIGQHVFPFLNSGQVGFRPGMFMASTDEFFITVKGKGGHGAMPQTTIDPILIASHIVVALQQIVSRNANPLVSTVVTVGRFIGEGRTNVIPDTVRLEGTVRTFDEEWRALVHDLLRQIANGTAEAMGGRCDITIDRGYPCLFNNEDLTAKLISLAGEYLGENNVKPMEQKMGAEDFAYFAREAPGCFFGLGIADPALGTSHNLHTAGFQVDESAMKTGMGLMAWLAARVMNVIV
ncbi:MAG: M20 family metallopeptidase [Bacteroidetes bacterium]|nr:M20 family metallopeptidase [Bacteroidota bacterium]